jgi:hypothetical protein
MLGFRAAVGLQEGLGQFIDWRAAQKSAVVDTEEVSVGVGGTL